MVDHPAVKITTRIILMFLLYNLGPVWTNGKKDKLRMMCHMVGILEKLECLESKL